MLLQRWQMQQNDAGVCAPRCKEADEQKGICDCTNKMRSKRVGDARRAPSTALLGKCPGLPSNLPPPP